MSEMGHQGLGFEGGRREGVRGEGTDRAVLGLSLHLVFVQIC